MCSEGLRHTCQQSLSFRVGESLKVTGLIKMCENDISWLAAMLSLGLVIQDLGSAW